MAQHANQKALNLGCGHEPKSGWVNVDRRMIVGVTDLVADIRHLPFRDQQFDAIVAENVLEHLTDPRPAIAEIARVLSHSDDASAILRVPALGTNAAHLDPTHRYLADLKHWSDLVAERFDRVKISSVGVRWRSSVSLVILQRILIAILGWHDLAQCWILTVRKPRQNFRKIVYNRWWIDD